MKLTDNLTDLETSRSITTWKEAFDEVRKVLDDPNRKLTVVAPVSEDEFAKGFFQPFYFEEWRTKLGEPKKFLEYLEDLMGMMHPGAKSFQLYYGSLEFPHPFMSFPVPDWLLTIVYR